MHSGDQPSFPPLLTRCSANHRSVVTLAGPLPPAAQVRAGVEAKVREAMVRAEELEQQLREQQEQHQAQLQVGCHRGNSACASSRATTRRAATACRSSCEACSWVLDEGRHMCTHTWLWLQHTGSAAGRPTYHCLGRARGHIWVGRGGLLCSHLANGAHCWSMVAAADMGRAPALCSLLQLSCPHQPFTAAKQGGLLWRPQLLFSTAAAAAAPALHASCSNAVVMVCCCCRRRRRCCCYRGYRCCRLSAAATGAAAAAAELPLPLTCCGRCRRWRKRRRS
jgi:hypothetical protein